MAKAAADAVAEMLLKMCEIGPLQRREARRQNFDEFQSREIPDTGSFTMREMEEVANDPEAISGFLNTSHYYKYPRIYHALTMVRSDNIGALNKYVDIIRVLFEETIRNSTHVNDARLICSLIETTPSLQLVHQILGQLMERVKNVRFVTGMGSGFDPQQPLQSRVNSRNPRSLPDRDWKSFDTDHFELVRIAHNNSILVNPNIITQDMDGVFAKWLNTCNLERYQWFFNGLSYLEIILIDEENIEDCITKVNNCAMTTNVIRKNVQDQICSKAKAMKHRPVKFKNILLVLQSEVKISEIVDFVSYMRDILLYPLPNKYCVVGEDLQEDIVTIMEKLFNVLLKNLYQTKYLVARSLQGRIINKFLECLLLIKGNQIFMKDHIDRVTLIRKLLKSKVKHMHKDFN